MHLKVWAAVCHPDFSELLFQGIFTFFLKTLFIAHMSRPAHTLSLYNRQISVVRPSLSIILAHLSRRIMGAYRMVLEPASVRASVHIYKVLSETT